MSKLYIFGIGGTGSRVLRSLTMLLASGVKLGEGINEVVPVIIDPDGQNGDLTRTVALMNAYMSIHKELHFDNDNQNTFFKIGVDAPLPNFLLPIKNTQSMKFKAFINVAGMSRPNEAITRMLFSGHNLEADMDKGFKGNPNMGSVVLNQFTSSNEFIQLASSFQNGDKIFIISSIFGGTGASGFPLLLKTLRSNKDIPNFDAINKATIGAVTVLPYFNVKQDNESEIDSSTFISKTKSALTYYQGNIIGNNNIDALYYLGDEQNNNYDNHDGQALQKNDAHVIEFLAASAVVDFTNQQFTPRTDPTYNPATQALNMEFGIKQADSTALTINDFYSGTKEDVIKPMTQLLLMANAFAHDFDYIKSANLNANKKLGLKEDFYRSPFCKTLRTFLKSYQEWLDEMKSNKRSLNLFNTNPGDHPFDLITAMQPKRYHSLKSNYNLFYDFINSACDAVKTKEKEDRLLELYSIATEKAIDGKFNF